MLSGTTPDRAWLKALPRVLAASDFIAQACVREPELLRGLLVSGNLARAYVPGELAMRVSRALEIVTDESALRSNYATYANAKWCASPFVTSPAGFTGGRLQKRRFGEADLEVLYKGFHTDSARSVIVGRET